MGTIGQTISEIQDELCDYIEATYHISHPSLIEERKRLLKQPGVIYQIPYLESTPKYTTGRPFEELDLHPSILKAFLAVGDQGGNRLIYDPPYSHQAEAVRQTLVEGKDIVVMTGTGSGKTECFLLPILGKLAREASTKGEQFASSLGLRALVLYPMNALVNDQLGRLRLLFGDNRITSLFNDWGGRPVRFARYTSRTLYPGIRTKNKDQTRLRPIRTYFIQHLKNINSENENKSKTARKLVNALQERGKWPVKEDLAAWFGGDRQKWEANGRFARCNTMPGDSELITRHEVFENPPDILVTNYSMLEYMLMRPIERPIFDQTRQWLETNPDEKLLLVVDEAHLYRGAAGAEVGLLLRRLRARLGVSPERIQVICTSASFDNHEYAKKFAAKLTGKNQKNFEAITGELDERPSAGPGNRNDVELLCSIDLEGFHNAVDDERVNYISDFVSSRGVKPRAPLNLVLFNALKNYSPLSELINISMKSALAIDSLGKHIFPGSPKENANKAITTLIALASLAKKDNAQPGLLPCRVHAFFRGLAGLWACLDPNCSELNETCRGGPAGRLYSQPRDVCNCGSKVFELYTCRNCGTAYARAYTDNVNDPRFLWNEQGSRIRTENGVLRELEPIDILLESPSTTTGSPPVEFDLDIVTGRGNPHNIGERTRSVYIQPITPEQGNDRNRRPGQFLPCGVCDKKGGYGFSTIQDHQTSGDQPFLALVTKQIAVQPPGPQQASRFAPLRGRKTLIFSDSRQVAARLAPNLKSLSMKDAIRPLLIYGMNRLSGIDAIRNEITLEHSYLAVVLAAHEVKVRLRPETNESEVFDAEDNIKGAIQGDTFTNSIKIKRYIERFNQNYRVPVSLLNAIYDVLFANYYGVESLALASLAETPDLTEELLKELPDLGGIAETEEQKIALVRCWIKFWAKPWTSDDRIWLSICPDDWRENSTDRSNRWIKTHNTGFFDKFGKVILESSQLKSEFRAQWLPILLEKFCQSSNNGYRMLGNNLRLILDGQWAYCDTCKTTQRPFPNRAICNQCRQGTISEIDPETHQVFSTRKGYYRKATRALRSEGKPPISLITAEHTAQLNAAQSEQIFSRAEEYELLFQDVDLDGVTAEAIGRPAVDVLSCTTTMEVGIDIGSLSGVALRNMPPRRANYQQRAGRAGRRANAIATVLGFASSDSHDEHYFSKPDQMISGRVEDPILTLENIEITKRHVRAFLLQRYHQDRCRDISPESQPANLFSVLGSVAAFRGDDAIINLQDFRGWLTSNLSRLREEIEDWLPSDLNSDDIAVLLNKLVEIAVDPIEKAIEFDANLEER